ncbi:hypothetical protein HK405_013957 [Cladochytrium tenue]|nr:hypothetical protein HK405_013957 [Cladochytrium tenue]
MTSQPPTSNSTPTLTVKDGNGRKGWSRRNPFSLTPKSPGSSQGTPPLRQVSGSITINAGPAPRRGWFQGLRSRSPTRGQSPGALVAATVSESAPPTLNAHIGVIPLTDARSPFDVALQALVSLDVNHGKLITDSSLKASDYIAQSKQRRSVSLPDDMDAANEDHPNMYLRSILQRVEALANSWNSASELQNPIKTAWALLFTFYQV